MTDRELLELAAKAAGFQEIKYQDMDGWGEVRYGYSHGIWNGKIYWNPLTNDGDALRLACDLNLNTFIVCNYAYALESESDQDIEQKVYCADDKYAAMRRAITLCAAEIAR